MSQASPTTPPDTEAAPVPSFAQLVATRTPEPITHGQGIVPWAPACKGAPAGWALPGGNRTQDREQANTCAFAIHRLICEQKANQSSAAPS